MVLINVVLKTGQHVGKKFNEVFCAYMFNKCAMCTTMQRQHSRVPKLSNTVTTNSSAPMLDALIVRQFKYSKRLFNG